LDCRRGPGRRVTGVAGWNERVGNRLAGAGDFFNNVLFVEREGERLADADIVERFALHVEADERGCAEGVGVKVGLVLDVLHQRGRDAAGVEDEIGFFE